MYIPEIWVGVAIGVIASFTVMFIVGAFIALVNDRNERVAAEK